MSTSAILVESQTVKSVKSIMDLPPTFVGNFNVYKDIPEAELLRVVDNNPVIGLCLRLSLLKLEDHRLYDMKSCKKDCMRLHSHISSSQRLYNSIGYKLQKGTFSRMLLLNSSQWETVQDAWRANMFTVILNKDFNPFVTDGKLRRSISKYKLWFINFALRGKIISKRRKDGTSFRHVVLYNIEKLLKGLKTIAGWLQYYLTDDYKDNCRPPSIPFWDGWHEKGAFPTFKWFGGHLLKWRMLEGAYKTDHDLANLCQIRTFGRALPCPTQNMCRDSLIEQVKILTTDRNVSGEICGIVKIFSSSIAKKLGISEMPRQTHISLSTSGSFEFPSSLGGMAAYCRQWIQQASQPVSMVKVHVNGRVNTVENTVSIYEAIRFKCLERSDLPSGISAAPASREPVYFYDCYGNDVFPRRIAFPRWFPRENEMLSEILFQESGYARKHSYLKELSGKDFLNPNTGDVLLLFAAQEASDQGHWLKIDQRTRQTRVVQPDFWLVLPSGKNLPLWRESNVLRYVPLVFPKVELTCLAEPGAKTRPLGKNQTWFTLVQRAMRFMVEPIIARDGRARIGLRSTNKMWSFLKYLGKIKYVNPFGQSSDYKSATDLIPLNVIKALWKGFLALLPERHPFRVYEELIWTPRSLSIDKKFRREFDDDIAHRCGSFMGEPLSFMTLTVINLLFEEISAYYYTVQRPLWSPVDEVLLGGDPVAICGDDVAAIRNDLERIFLFKKVVRDCGMDLSWKDAISKRILIFCEDHVLIKTLGEDTHYEYIDVIKTRLLTTMTRQHSDNRSSILGKGRMLRNQLDYFDEVNMKTVVLSLYRSVFDYAYKDALKGLRLPFFLPPACGGLGFPITEKQIPEWGWKYIGYVYLCLKDTEMAVKITALSDLSSLNSRNKHGLSETELARKIFEKEIKTFKVRFESDLPDSITQKVIYTNKCVSNIVEHVYNRRVPTDPYTGMEDREALDNEAQSLGFIPFKELFDQFERVCNFQTFLTEEDVVRQQRTFNQWVKDSKRFWKKRTKDVNYLVNLGKENFKSFADLERQVNSQFFGYIWNDVNSISVMNSGPSLKINFNNLQRQKILPLSIGSKTHTSVVNLTSAIEGERKNFPYIMG